MGVNQSLVPNVERPITSTAGNGKTFKAETDMKAWRAKNRHIDEAHGPFKWLSYEFNTQKYLSNQNWNQNWCIRKMVSIDHGAPSSLFPQLLFTLTCVFIASLHLVLCYLLYCTRYICIASLHLVLCYLLYCTHYICTQLIINCQKTWKYIYLYLYGPLHFTWWINAKQKPRKQLRYFHFDLTKWF